LFSEDNKLFIIMERRLFKQLIISGILLGLAILISYDIYFTLKPVPTCYDGIKNQNEEDIDCGGICLPCDLKYQKVLTVASEPKIFLKPNNKVDLYFKLRNISEEWGAEELYYKVVFYSSDGTLKEELIQKGFILPHEIRYYLLQEIALPFTPSKAEVEIMSDNIQWAKPLEGINLALGNAFLLTNLKMYYPSEEEGGKNIYLFTKSLEKGMKDAEVYNLQKVLAQDPTVYPEGQITGYFGELTEKAVKRFQSKYGIRVTGEVGPQTRAKLNELFGPEYTEPFSYTFNTFLQKGMSGVEVANLQRALMIDSTAHPKGLISGTFDDNTEKVLKEFQKKYNLEPTGVVDKATREKLNELFSKENEYNPSLIGGTISPAQAKLEITGEIFNSSIYNFKEGEVGFILCNQQNQEVAIGKTFIEGIYSNQRKNFRVNFYQDLPQGIKICYEVVSINILSSSNVIK